MSRKTRELEAIIRAKNITIRDLEARLAGHNRRFEKMQEVSNNTDPDCTPGPYCKVCAHSKAFAMRFDHGLEYVYLCNKNGGCKNFILKESTDDEQTSTLNKKGAKK